MSEDEKDLTIEELWKLAGDVNIETRARALLDLSSRLLNEGSLDQSISCAATAVDLFTSLDYPSSLARAAFIHGCGLLRIDSPKEALESLIVSADILRSHSDEEQLALAVLEQAHAHLQLENWSEAEKDFESAVRLFLNSDDYSCAGDTAIEHGELLGSQGKQSAALEMFISAREILQNTDRPIAVAEADDRIAAALIELGQGDRAIKHLRDALAVAEYMGTPKIYAWALYRLGWTLVTFKYFNEAFSLLEKASEMFKSESQFLNAANADIQYAHALSGIGKYDEAHSMYTKIRPIFDAFGRASDVILVSVNQAANLARADRHLDAKLLYESVLEHLNDSKEGYIYRGTCIRLADVFLDLDLPQEVLLLLEPISRDSWGDNLIEKARYINALAKAKAKLGQGAEAERLSREVLSLNLGAGSEEENAEAYETLSVLARNLGKEKEADQLLSLAIALYLADGMEKRARKLSEHFLSSSSTPTKDLFRRNSDPEQTADEDPRD